MTIRLITGGGLGLAAVLAALAVSLPLVARGLQIAVVGSAAYVGWLAWRGRRVVAGALAADPASPRADLGSVTLIIPARNEAAVIGATLASVAALKAEGTPDHEVLVIDDASDDATAALAVAAAAGRPGIRVLHRPPSDGPRTKAAVLDWAMAHASGRVIGVIDADARVAPGFLADLARAWARDPAAAAIQVRRVERNARRSWLAAAQDEEQIMDLVSQCGRWAGGGNAELRGNGMFVRREVLETIGGWATTAITEDLELSSRLVAHGWGVALAPDVQVEEEAVEAWGALWRQRLRWAEGSIRRLVTHGPAVIGGRLSLQRKADFAAFCLEFVVPPVLLASILASMVLTWLARPADWSVPASLVAGYLFGTLALGLAGLHAVGVRGRRLTVRACRGSLFLSHWLLVVPVVLARIAVGPATRDFVQTPRFGRDDA